MLSFLARAVVLGAVVFLAVAAWQIKHAVLLLFGGFIFASILDGSARWIHQVTGASQSVASCE